MRKKPPAASLLRPTTRPANGWGSRRSTQLAVLLARRSTAPVSLPVLKFMDGRDDEPPPEHALRR
jgi:hypothetical protein